MLKICLLVIKDGFVYWVWWEFYCLRLDDGFMVWKGGVYGDVGLFVVMLDDWFVMWVGNGDFYFFNDVMCFLCEL